MSQARKVILIHSFIHNNVSQISFSNHTLHSINKGRKEYTNNEKVSTNTNAIGEEKEEEEEYNEDDDDYVSEDDLQEEDGDDSDEEEDIIDDDILFNRKLPRSGEYVKWQLCDDVRSTNYHYAGYKEPRLLNYVDWDTITPYDIFHMQLPVGEIQLWVSLTNLNLRRARKEATNTTEMKLFLGCMMACTQSSKIGGITKAFSKEFDGLFPAADLGRFGLKLRRFQTLMKYWEFADSTAPNVNLDDPYWRTEQFFDRFNNRYKSFLSHGQYVNVDERVFWCYARAQPEGIKSIGRKPKGTGQECKTMSCVGVNVTTTFEHVRAKNTVVSREYTREYGAAAAVVLRLCVKAGIEGTNRIVIADSWFANMSLLKGLRLKGLHLLGQIKQGDGGFPRVGLCKELDKEENRPRGSYAVATATYENEKVIALAWKGKLLFNN